MQTRLPSQSDSLPARIRINADPRPVIPTPPSSHTDTEVSAPAAQNAHANTVENGTISGAELGGNSKRKDRFGRARTASGMRFMTDGDATTYPAVRGRFVAMEPDPPAQVVENGIAPQAALTTLLTNGGALISSLVASAVLARKRSIIALTPVPGLSLPPKDQNQELFNPFWTTPTTSLEENDPLSTSERSHTQSRNPGVPTRVLTRPLIPLPISQYPAALDDADQPISRILTTRPAHAHRSLHYLSTENRNKCPNSPPIQALHETDASKQPDHGATTSSLESKFEAYQPWNANTTAFGENFNTAWQSSFDQARTLDNSGWLNLPSTSSTFHFYDSVTPHMLSVSSSSIIREPSLQFSRETWWDNVLNIYSIQSPAGGSLPLYPPPLTRQAAALEVSRDICSFFTLAPTWVSFINVSMFLSTFHHAEYRATMQPALVLSILATSKLLQTSQDPGDGRAIREEKERMWVKSIMLRELAQAAFEASYNAGWIDTSLTQAAWISQTALPMLANYELSVHRDLTTQRMESTMILLDNIIHVLGLERIDAGNPRASMFKAGAVPALGRPRPYNYYRERSYASGSNDVSTRPSTLPDLLQADRAHRNLVHYQPTTQPTPFDLCRTGSSMALTQVSIYSNANVNLEACPCRPLSLAESPEAHRCTPLWLSTPQWDPGVSWAELKKEEARRVVWTSVMMIASDAAARLALGLPQLDLHIAKPENHYLSLSSCTLQAIIATYASVSSMDSSHYYILEKMLMLHDQN
ncbi:hypothetical protein FRB98_004688 [Tulasnella sp. 332]|nr:hypothetical protein FRB98_004688 [Tulasnella sp. 332]